MLKGCPKRITSVTLPISPKIRELNNVFFVTQSRTMDYTKFRKAKYHQTWCILCVLTLRNLVKLLKDMRILGSIGIVRNDFSLTFWTVFL